MENKKKVKVISFVSAMMLFVIVIAAAFAYFSDMSAGLTNNVAVNVTALSGGNVVFTSNATQLNIQVSGAAMERSNNSTVNAIAENTATLSVNLISGDDNQLVSCTYDIVYEYDYNSYIYGDDVTYVSKNEETNTTVTKEITMQVSGPSTGTNNYNEEKNFNYDSSWTAKDTTNSVGAKRVLVSNAIINNNSATKETEQKWTITGKYYNLDVFQGQLSEKGFTGKIYVSNKNCDIIALDIPGTIGKKLLSNNNLNAEKPNFDNIATLNEGLYLSEDNFGTSYYFRGAVDNNWVKFGKDNSNNDMYWRIIRINGDGSVRLIYTGTTAPIENQKVIMTGDGTQATTTVYNNSCETTACVGYQYISDQQYGYGKCDSQNENCTIDGNTVNNSKIKQALDSWYSSTSLVSTDSSIVVDAIYCNDRDAGLWEKYNYAEFGYYYPANRLNLGYLSKGTAPSLICSEKSDMFTVNKIILNDESEFGNGALTYPVGLITADELLMAGGNPKSDNTNYYLYTNQDYWSMSPYGFYEDYGYTFYTTSSGKISDSTPDRTALGVRPVISISKDANLSGNGTWNNPYVVGS